MSRRILLQGTAAAGAAFALPSGWAQSTSWPEGPVRIIAPFPGGASDTLTRVLAEQLQSRLGQTFFVEPRSGAGGNIGMEATKNAPPDGYTAVATTIGTLSINQYLYSKLPYDPVSDFAYVSTFWENCNVFVVSANHPAKSVQDFIGWARKQAKGVSFGSAGVGTTPHLAGDLFRVRTGLNAVHIPFRGAAQSMPALVAGDTDFAIDNIASYMPLIRAGRVRALAVTSSDRWPTLPDVPTMAESGVKDFIITSWGSVLMPKATPAPIVDKFSAAIRAICADAALQQRFLEIGARATGSTPQEAFAFAERERVKWKEIVRLSGAKVD
jgi:tripartite-type tricarboxylate transporter receptor subunit TctC